MDISKVDMLRDGGTIIIKTSNDPKAGEYTLPTPWSGEPRHIHWNGEKLAIGSLEEYEFLTKIKRWWEAQLTEEIRDALETLDKLREWRNLPEKLQSAVSFHRVRTVIEYLEKRHPSKSSTAES
ncbi:MAG: hypothetical protein HZB52_05305 [Chloroflexi bacterium]|nr:hypothetical protein [Chloroflexota bacterium]